MLNYKYTLDLPLSFLFLNGIFICQQTGRRANKFNMKNLND